MVYYDIPLGIFDIRGCGGLVSLDGEQCYGLRENRLSAGVGKAVAEHDIGTNPDGNSAMRQSWSIEELLNVMLVICASMCRICILNHKP